MPTNDPWQVTEQVLIPRPAGSTVTRQYVCVNGHSLWVPVGETVSVPGPIAEAIRAMLAHQESLKPDPVPQTGGGYTLFIAAATADEAKEVGGI